MVLCDICGKCFARASELNSRKLTIHLKYKQTLNKQKIKSGKKMRRCHLKKTSDDIIILSRSSKIANRHHQQKAF
jgi:hypothetical protein